MSDVMSVQHWLKFTDAGTLAVRGAKLKAVDTALAQFEKTKSATDKDRVRTALMAWIMEQGPAWKNGPRNRYHAIDDLYRQVMDLPGPKKSAAEMIALSHVQDEQRAILEIFQNKKLEWREGYLAKLANNKWSVHLNSGSVAWNARKLAPGGAAALSAEQVARRIVEALVPTMVLPEVLLMVGLTIPNFMVQLAAAVTPFLGVITAGAGALWNLKNTVQAEYTLQQTQMHAERTLSTGNPELALQAILRILERDRNYQAFAASVSFGEFVGKLGGALLDGGTATTAALGLSASLAKLGNTVRVIARDVLEKNAANALMRKRVDITVFETCPILGAYYVCCVPTSVLVNQIYARWYEQGWRGDVERAVVRHVEPVREQARFLIQQHRFVIPGLQRFPGVLSRNEDALAAMEARMGKSGMEGFGSDNLPG